MEEQIKNIKTEVIIQEKERSKLKNINHEIKEIHKTLMENLTVLNEKMSHIIPGSLKTGEKQFELQNKEDEVNEENYCSDDSETEEPVNPDEATHTDVTNATLLAQV